MLSLISYGAGIKGKITDSWYNSTPCISTYFGCEGLFLNELQNENSNFDKHNLIDSLDNIFNLYSEKLIKNECENWGGFYSNDIDDLIEKSYLLYTNEKVWKDKIELGNKILSKKMSCQVIELHTKSKK